MTVLLLFFSEKKTVGNPPGGFNHIQNGHGKDENIFKIKFIDDKKKKFDIYKSIELDITLT